MGKNDSLKKRKFKFIFEKMDSFDSRKFKIFFLHLKNLKFSFENFKY